MQTASLQKMEVIFAPNDVSTIDHAVTKSFSYIAPFWPLKNLIAVNPLQGFEDLPIEEALKTAAAYFEQPELPENMLAINCETIKWLQAYFDEGQATITMPDRKSGLYASWRQLALYDVKLHQHDKEKQAILASLPKTAKEAIIACLLKLGIAKKEHTQFLTLMLTTLPGWAAYIKYRTVWANDNHSSPLEQEEYLALRLIITVLLWPEAKYLLYWQQTILQQVETKTQLLESIEKSEKAYRDELLAKLATQKRQAKKIPEAQLVFCIDVRSEPLRKRLEAVGNYHTFGFAGFFGVMVQINNPITKESYASCPVLLTPKHKVDEVPCSLKAYKDDTQGYKRFTILKKLYQAVKYTFTTPFALVESIGIVSGLWLAIRSFWPRIAMQIKTMLVTAIRNNQELRPTLDNISFTEQCSYALNALKMMGLTSHFAPLVVLCGHGSATQNNAYASALDCGACAGRHGASNAKILAAILNRQQIREYLATEGIEILPSTSFIAAEHNTTTDEVTLYDNYESPNITKLKADLFKARKANSDFRLQKMTTNKEIANSILATLLRAQDWAQVRPEWGLAGNSAFIIAPRDFTASIDLEGRCFLHSYDYNTDLDGSYLSIILTAPMVVAQWINAQYLFSTIDNVAYGGGSKITKNITGKIGIMQGNASDLMTGLPLQSVYSSDALAYHQPMRLLTVVFAPCYIIDKIINKQAILQKLFGNGWVRLIAIHPEDHKINLLNRDLTWQQIKN